MAFRTTRRLFITSRAIPGGAVYEAGKRIPDDAVPSARPLPSWCEEYDECSGTTVEQSTPIDAAPLGSLAPPAPYAPAEVKPARTNPKRAKHRK